MLGCEIDPDCLQLIVGLLPFSVVQTFGGHLRVGLGER